MSGKGPYKSVDEEAPAFGLEPSSDSMTQAKSNQLEIQAPEEKKEDDQNNEKPTLKPEDLSKIKDHAPKLSFLALFVKFLWFGCRGMCISISIII